MEIFSLPERVRALVLDIDGTLYSHPGYAESQVRVLVERLARERSWTMEETLARVAAAEREWTASRGGGRTSLGNAFTALGVPIETSVRWREELIRPEGHLSPDRLLRKALESLSASRALACLTNNPGSIGRRTLEALGVSDLVPVVLGLDATGKSKPEREPFIAVLDALGLPARDCVSVGDRMDIDINPALGLGMGGILVRGVEEVLLLPGFLASREETVA
jgi:FMN phosphatase YigB (HAD superfamily)